MSPETTAKLALLSLNGRVSAYQLMVDSLEIQVAVATAVLADGANPPVSVETLQRELTYAVELRDGAITARTNILSAMGE